jgi:hypothetical protein
VNTVRPNQQVTLVLGPIAKGDLGSFRILIRSVTVIKPEIGARNMHTAETTLLAT